MAIREILTEPNKILRQKSLLVEKVDSETQKLMDDMLETMYAAPGIGLAAIQVGVPKRIIVLDLAKKDEPKQPMYFVNPEIIEKSNVINNASSLCEKILSDIGFAMLPGKNFGFDDEKLITRIAFVDFDGEKALEFLNNNDKIKTENYEELFPKIIEGTKKLKGWLSDLNSPT